MINFPAKAQSKTTAAAIPASSSSSSSRPSAARGPRTPIRRVVAQTTRLEALDDSLGPLGPLGDNVPTPIAQPEQPPDPPRKEQTSTLNTRQGPGPSQSSVERTSIDAGDEDDSEPTGRPRIPPPVQPPQGGPLRRDTQPSVSIEQAAKPTFDITVGDPHKVGDLTSSHIVYQVRTKVW